MAAGLRVIRQTSLSTEKFNQDGKLHTVAVLLKDKPFLVEIGRSAGNVDLKTAVLEANLYFDSPEKEVDWIKVKPFDYTAKCASDGASATFECYIHILSSQNENALFRVHIKARLTSGKRAGETLEITTDPLQVISKPSVLRKKHEREKQKHDDLIATSGATSAAPVNAPSSHKRTRDDVILETLSLIQRQQAQQQRMLEALSQGSPHQSPSSPASPSDNSVGTPPLRFHASPARESDAPEDFESAFRTCLRAFNGMDPSERSAKVRKVLRETGTQAAPFVDTLWAESFQKDIEAQVGTLGSLSVEIEPPSWKLNSSDANWKSNSDFLLPPSAASTAAVVDMIQS